MLIQLISIYHSINRFLGTYNGDLVKRAVELFLLILTTYMIASEYSKSRERHLKYLIIAFAVLALERLIMTAVLVNIVFGSHNLNPVLDLFVVCNCLEILGLILIANAFLYPLFERRMGLLRKSIKYSLIALAVFFIILESIWYFTPKNVASLRLSVKLIMLLTELVKIAVLAIPIYLMIRKRSFFGRYNLSTIIAFAVYMVTPTLDFINRAFFNSTHYQLIVLTHPFPFISVVLLLRVVYLKLVDKATLRVKLSQTQLKYQQQKHVSRLKDEFMSIMSHELRTPLTSMNLYTSLLIDGRMGPLNDKQKQTISVVKGEGQRLANLISDILDLSRLEAKKVKLKYSKCNLHSLVENSVYKNLAEQKKIAVINNVPKDFMVYVDVDKFTQVFINLFSNAIKYTDENGKIILEARRLPREWEFSVTDNGKGIPKQQIPKLFDKFFQVEDYLTREKGGSGLGLSIVKKIVNLHRGKILVKSKLGKGSTFTVIMPNKWQK